MPQETAAVSAHSVYTIQPCTMSLHAKPHTQGVCVFSCNLPPALFGRMTGVFYEIKRRKVVLDPQLTERAQERSRGREVEAGIRKLDYLLLQLVLNSCAKDGHCPCDLSAISWRGPGYCFNVVVYLSLIRNQFFYFNVPHIQNSFTLTSSSKHW